MDGKLFGIGNAAIRERMMNRMEAEVQWYTAIHPSAVMGYDVALGEGSVIMAGAVVVKDIDEAGTYIGVPARKS